MIDLTGKQLEQTLLQPAFVQLQEELNKKLPGVQIFINRINAEYVNSSGNAEARINYQYVIGDNRGNAECVLTGFPARNMRQIEPVTALCIIANITSFLKLHSGEMQDHNQKTIRLLQNRISELQTANRTLSHLK